MDKKIEISILLDIYSNLLTEKQYDFLNDYYNNDLSLSEIAENEGITRQAVRDNLKKGENKLFEYEEKLCFMKRTLKQEEQIVTILQELTKIQTHKSKSEALQKAARFVYFFFFLALFFTGLRLGLFCVRI